jgi:hypothetical protein
VSRRLATERFFQIPVRVADALRRGELTFSQFGLLCFIGSPVDYESEEAILVTPRARRRLRVGPFAGLAAEEPHRSSRGRLDRLRLQAWSAEAVRLSAEGGRSQEKWRPRSDLSPDLRSDLSRRTRYAG